MLSWRTVLVDAILPAVREDKFWYKQIKGLISDDRFPAGVHLAIFVEPYLSYVLEGKKVVESRFSIHRRPPYGHVATGDIILLKSSGGPIQGLCIVSHVWLYSLDPTSWDNIRRDFTMALCAQDPEFWRQRQSASYATLMKIDSVLSIPPVTFPKRDRRGWVVLREPFDSSLEVSKT